MRISLRLPAAVAALVLLLAACSGTTGSTWTIAPLHATPSVAPSVAASEPAGSPGETQPAGSPGETQPAGSPGETQPAGSPGGSQPAGSPGETQPAGSPVASQPAAGGQTIELDLTNALQITRDGAQVTELEVHDGETIHFVINNTAGFDHDFYIGTADQLSQGTTDGLPGVPVFSSGTQEFDYTVTADTDGLQFACTVPGHYQSMHGTFKVVP